MGPPANGCTVFRVNDLGNGDFCQTLDRQLVWVLCAASLVRRGFVSGNDAESVLLKAITISYHRCSRKTTTLLLSRWLDDGSVELNILWSAAVFFLNFGNRPRWSIVVSLLACYFSELIFIENSCPISNKIERHKKLSRIMSACFHRFVCSVCIFSAIVLAGCVTTKPVRRQRVWDK